MSPECVGCQDATNSDTLQVVSLFSKHPASYSVFCWNGFILHIFLPGIGGVVSAHASSVCYCFRQKGELRGQESIHSLGFLTHTWGLGAWCQERMRDQYMFFRNRAGRGQKPWGDAQLQSCVVCGGDWPLWSFNRQNVSLSPIDGTRALTFHLTNPRTSLPSPPTAWPHAAIWSCMISSAGRGMPWERQCRDAHTQTHTRAHIRLQPSASSAPLHALSFVSSTSFLKPC